MKSFNLVGICLRKAFLQGGSFAQKSFVFFLCQSRKLLYQEHASHSDMLYRPFFRLVEVSLWAAKECAYDPFDERKNWHSSQAVCYNPLKAIPCHAFRAWPQMSEGCQACCGASHEHGHHEEENFSRSYFVCVSSVPIDAVCDSRWCVTANLLSKVGGLESCLGLSPINVDDYSSLLD